MEVQKIYFDMDDTIADFSRGLIEICGIRPIPQDSATREQEDAMWAAIREAGNFYYRLEECAPGMALLKQLREKYGDKVEILTALPKPRRGIVTSESDKLRWVSQHIEGSIVVNTTHSAEEKKEKSGPGCFLIDDLARNIESWEKAGGTGILFNKDDMDLTNDAIRKSML